MSLVEITGITCEQADDPSKCAVFSKTGPFAQIARDLEQFNHDRIPVSACFVINERIRERIAQL
jgi:hypothetical protein